MTDNDMNLPAELRIRPSITPHDVSLIILIYFYCLDDGAIAIPPKVFIALLTPSIAAPDINPILKKSLPRHASHRPLVPLLAPLIDYLLRNNAKGAAIRIVSFLQSMESLDVFTQLLKTLEKNCLIKNYRSPKSLPSVYKKRITRSSYIGIYLEGCLTKYQIGDFKEREALWICLSQYLADFKQTSYWSSIKSDIITFEYNFMPQAESNEADRNMISFFKEMSSNIYSVNSSCLMIDHTYFQSMLNWQIYDTCQNGSKIDNTTLLLLDKLSLNDVTHFPAVHIIRYLIAVRENSYQDALDALHNYFDYLLTQNEESCFHISLLCLATFHMCLHDCPAAINAFEEATKIARENKDTETLNLIMIWVVDFIEVYPEYANQFHVTVDQIVRYLKSCSDEENGLVFENAYKFESLLQLMDNTSSVLYLESTFKYVVIALQRLQAGANMSPAFKHVANLWDYLGYSSLSEVYMRCITCEKDPIEKGLEEAFNALEFQQYDSVSKFLLKLDSPRLTNEQSMMFKLLEIKLCIAMEDYKLAMANINEKIKEFELNTYDAKWKFLFELQRCGIFLSSNLAIRAVPLIEEMLDDSVAGQNTFHAAHSIILLCKVLQMIGKKREFKELLSSNLATILQFPQLESKILNLIDVSTV